VVNWKALPGPLGSPINHVILWKKLFDALRNTEGGVEIPGMGWQKEGCFDRGFISGDSQMVGARGWGWGSASRSK